MALNSGSKPWSGHPGATVAEDRPHPGPDLRLQPEVLAEPPAVQMYRHRILDEAHIPHLLVPIQPTWVIPGNRHPDALGDRAMVQAVVARLQFSEGQVQK